MCKWRGAVVKGIVVKIHLAIGDEGGKVVLVVDVEDRDGFV
jgi:hypothetical protein